MRKIFKYVLTGVLALIILGFACQFIFTVIDDLSYPPSGKLVDMGGYRLHIHCMGKSETGLPTVILDAGLGGFSLDWVEVQPEVAKFARVCSYDRAGYGFSDESPHQRTSKYIITELRDLLIRSKEQAPFIMVGHSFGGINTRLFAHAYPENVAGIILIDSSHEDQGDRLPEPPYEFLSLLSLQKFVTERPWLAGIAGSSGLSRLILQTQAPKYLPVHVQKEIRDAYLAKISSSKFIKSLSLEKIHFDESLLQLKAKAEFAHVPELDDKPLYVISAGKPEYWEGMSAAWQRWAEMNFAVWQALQKDLVTKSSNVKHIVAAKSGHMIPRDQPDIIIAQIKQMFDALVVE